MGCDFYVVYVYFVLYVGYYFGFEMLLMKLFVDLVFDCILGV